VELQRYLHKLEDLNLQDSIITLRNAFYGSTESSISVKGTWTHCPNQKYLSTHASQYQVATNLLNKLSEVCLRAYMSFHRSLQSAAFLQILLMFVAISSRTQSLAQELETIVKDMHTCTEKLIAVIFLQRQQRSKNLSNIIPALTPINTAVIESIAPPVLIDNPISKPVHEAVINPPEELKQMMATSILAVPVENVILKRKASKKTHREIEQSKKPSNNVPEPRKKKRKAPKNEIDDIFGF